MQTLTFDEINRFVLNKQHLTDEVKRNNIPEIVKDIGGLHATSSDVPYLSLFSRIPNFEKDWLDKELYVNKTLGKIRCIRRTLHILPEELIPIYFNATNSFINRISRKYMEARGVSIDKYKKIIKSIINLISDQELNIIEIKKKLQTNLNVSTILNLMCDQGLLIRTRPRYYVVFKEFFPNMDLNVVDEAEAITMLVKQYLSSFGAITEEDIFWWTGIGKIKIRKALEEIYGDLIELKILNLNYKFIILKNDLELLDHLKFHQEFIVNVLPTLDPYLMGYKNRERYIDSQFYNCTFDRTGNVTSTILVNGRIIGIWDLINAQDPILKVFFFEQINDDILCEIFTKLHKMGAFITNRECQIIECESMTPLNKKSVGSFLKPLDDC